MKKLIIILASSVLAVACKPAQKDPPLDFDHTRQDAKVSEMKLEASHPIVQIGIPELWAKNILGKTPDGGRVRIAIVGTGIDYTIPDIRDALWQNLGEYSDRMRVNGTDDDTNGSIDDVIGYDFFSGHSMPYDWHGHDTFAASVIAATGRANSKVIGVAPNAEIVVARYIGPEGTGGGMDAVPALEYVIANGAKVVYFNWPEGGFDAESTPLIVQTIMAAAEKNILFVIPAGNSANQKIPAFLKALAKAQNVIIVSGVGKDGKLSASTNSGRNLSTVAAPAMAIGYLPGGIVSSDLQSSSVAAAYVAGAAALISTIPGMGSVQKIRNALLAATTARKKTPGDAVDVLSGASLYLGN